jgi:uncharacterized integral membrane protein (TIGR00698 family)
MRPQQLANAETHFPQAQAAKARATHTRSFGIWPGILLTASIGAFAFALRQIPSLSTFSPMILAIVLGIGFHNFVGTPVRAKEGVAFSLRKVLRAGIILLGLQLTAAQVVLVGPAGIGIIAATLVATFAFTTWFGRVIGVDRKLTELIAAGTSICGASAVIATNTVTNTQDEDVAYALACVTVFGTLSMFVYPLLPVLFHLDPHDYGLWAGASIHEVAQVVAASFQYGQAAGEFGTIAKLSRVMMLAPVVILLGWLAVRRRSSGANHRPAAGAPMPWFVFGFVAMVAINSVVVIPSQVRTWIVTATTFLLSTALAALGLETDVRKLRAKGARPFLLGAASWLFIGAFSLALVKWIG